MNLEKYQQLSESEKSAFIKKRYEKQQPYEVKDVTSPYATSRDWNMRELEIQFILENLPRKAREILDIGCGNGYTDFRIAERCKCDILGIDFSYPLLNATNKLRQQFTLKGDVRFHRKDVTSLESLQLKFDVILSERLLTNMASRKIQTSVIRTIYNTLKIAGTFIMIEGSLNGLYAMNRMRQQFGLESIPNRDKDNVQSLKFVEGQLERYIKPMFVIVKKQHWGMYYFISRVIHPMLVSPKEPRFDASMNVVARKIATKLPEHETTGHVVGYALQKI